jgi:hypothetical protein
MHAAFSNDPAQRDAIRKARETLVEKIRKLKTFNDTAGEFGEPLNNLNTYFGTFYETLRLYKYL